ncbi:MAG TPA: chromate efflux transporter [Anaerolineales bacterium]
MLKLGLTAFGGPAAHIAMMHDETVRRRRWFSDQDFLDLVGATNLIPGPNSTEMAVHIGFLRAGWPGLILGGLSFIGPAVLIVLGLAWVYVRFGAAPEAEGLLYGVKPVVIAVIVQAIWNLGRAAVKGPLTGAIAATAVVLYFLGFNEIGLLFAGGLVVMLVRNFARLRPPRWSALLIPWGGVAGLTPAVPFGLPLLFLTFLKIGAVLYGSGYVLLAFLRADLVVRFGWLTDTQLLDAIAIGQVTPGPVFTTATFIGFLLGGLPGALLATVGIFLPSFVFVALSSPLIPRIRHSPWLNGLLDGVNAVAVGMMAAVTWLLAKTSLTDLPTVGIALASLVFLIRFKVNSTWLIAAGAILGLLTMGRT